MTAKAQIAKEDKKDKAEKRKLEPRLEESFPASAPVSVTRPHPSERLPADGAETGSLAGSIQLFGI